ncbi:MULTISPECIES: SDR family oxidoreductase [unclassified Mycobacterium]|uniref:SDR family oxidoreductase n=1 Tax=unclassified Mycobacterium TaxID=2642494 RepID=UPI0029C6901E|nr:MULTISPECIES: NAD(P)H-binding protein [unclassified Mycobacterium]
MSEIVIAGAAGWAGIELVRALAAVDADFSVISHSDAGAERLHAAGARDVVRADLAEQSTLTSAFTGARSVYAIPPALHPREDELIINAVRVAEACGVERFTYHSVMHPNTPFLRNHLRKARAESILQSSRLKWTILQPSMYAQVVMAMFGGQPAGVVKVPFNVDAEIAMLDLVESAEIGAKILTQPGVHDYATYELAGPLTTMRRAVTAVARARGIDLQPETVRVDQGPLPPAAQENSEAAADMISTFAHYDRHGFCGNPFVLTQLLGRAPAAFDDVAARQFASATP